MPTVHFDSTTHKESTERDKRDTRLNTLSAQSHTLVQHKATTQHADSPCHASPLSTVVAEGDAITAASTADYKADCGDESGGLEAYEETGLGTPRAQLSHSAVSETDSDWDRTTKTPAHRKPTLDAEWRGRQLTDADCFDRESVKGMRLGPDYSIVYLYDPGMSGQLSEEGARTRYCLEKDGKLHKPLPRDLQEDHFSSTRDPLSLSDGTLHKSENTGRWDSLIKLAVPTDKLMVFSDGVFESMANPEEGWRRVKELQRGEYLNEDRKPSRYPADRREISDEDDPDVIFATEKIPTSKILRDEDIPEKFLQLIRNAYGIPIIRGV